MAGKQQKYLSYMLRLWQLVVDGQPVWRASPESAQTGQPRGFASLTQLAAFLEAEMAVTNPPEEVALVISEETYDEGRMPGIEKKLTEHRPSK